VAVVKRSKHEIALEGALRIYGHDLPQYAAEFKAVPGRNFRWDFAWQAEAVLVEIQGGTFGKGRSAHTGASLARDFEKHNFATLLGYHTLYFTARDMTARTLHATVNTIRKALRRTR